MPQAYDTDAAQATAAILLSSVAAIVSVGLLAAHFRATVAG